MKKIIALALVLVMVLSLFAGCGKKAEKMTLKVWGPNEDQASAESFLPVACEKFNEAHPEWDIEFVYEVCAEGDAGTMVTKDPSAAGDVYMFANDQLGTLLQANAIARLGGAVLDQVVADNSETMVASVTSGDGVYGVPFTGNTWFMYYDSSVYTEEDIKSLDAMMAKGTVAFPLTNTWYLPAFYYANGGTMFGDGTDGSKGINFGGEAGAAVTTYIANAVASGKLIDDANGVGLDGFRKGEVVAMFSGTWDAKNYQDALGENYAAAQLPTITINGEAKQLRAFAGSKCIGVNPNCKNQKAALQLALFLGSKDAQLSHYTMGNIAPCHPELAADPTIAADVAVAALINGIANSSVLQPTIAEMGNYWAPAANMASEIINGTVTHENAAEKTAAFVDAINGKGGL